MPVDSLARRGDSLGLCRDPQVSLCDSLVADGDPRVSLCELLGLAIESIALAIDALITYQEAAPCN